MYFDDIIVFSLTAGEHAVLLRKVFAKLRGASVFLKAEKRHLFQEKMEYLRLIVGRRQLKMQDKKVLGLQEASSPRCKKNLRSFLGMCNIHRRFVQEYAQVAWSLAAMTRFKRPESWGTLSDEALVTLEDLKRLRTAAPILAIPR